MNEEGQRKRERERPKHALALAFSFLAKIIILHLEAMPYKKYVR